MPKVRILDRYIFSELLPPFFLSLALLTFVFFLQKMFRLAELVVSKGATVWAALKLLLYIMPSFLVITIPMSLLVASLAAFARLCTDSEVTAMKASQVSLYRMMRPAMLMAVIAFVFTAVISLSLLPAANRALKTHLFNMVKSRAMVGIEQGVFTNTFDGIVIYIDKMKSLDEMEGIFLSDERSAKDPYAIVSKRGRLIADPQSFRVTLAMDDGAVHGMPQAARSYSLISFDSARLYLDINHALLPAKTQDKEFKEIGTLELLKEIGRRKAEGASSAGMESEFHQRLSIPFACLIFGLIGVPLGIRRSRSGKSASIAIALFVFLIYYVTVASGRNLAEAGRLTPAAAYWLPNALAVAAASVIIVKKGREMHFGIIDRISAAWRYVRSKIIF